MIDGEIDSAIKVQAQIPSDSGNVFQIQGWKTMHNLEWIGCVGGGSTRISIIKVVI